MSSGCGHAAADAERHRPQLERVHVRAHGAAEPHPRQFRLAERPARREDRRIREARYCSVHVDDEAWNRRRRLLRAGRPGDADEGCQHAHGRERSQSSHQGATFVPPALSGCRIPEDRLRS